MRKATISFIISVICLSVVPPACIEQLGSYYMISSKFDVWLSKIFIYQLMNNRVALKEY